MKSLMQLSLLAHVDDEGNFMIIDGDHDKPSPDNEWASFG